MVKKNKDSSIFVIFADVQERIKGLKIIKVDLKQLFDHRLFDSKIEYSTRIKLESLSSTNNVI